MIVVRPLRIDVYMHSKAVNLPDILSQDLHSGLSAYASTSRPPPPSWTNLAAHRPPRAPLGAGFALLPLPRYSPLDLSAQAEGPIDKTGAGSYPCRKRRSASRLSCSACLVTRAFVAR
jgi:hypothetical protein